MHHFQKHLVILAMSLMLAACGDTDGISSGGGTLDTSSEEAMASSIEAMTEDMSDSERQQLAEALAGIMMMRGFAMYGEDISEEEMNERMMEGLHGLTAAEILAKADEVKAEMEAARR